MTDTPRRRALVVGIDRYVPAAPAGEASAGRGRGAVRAAFSDLAGAVRDARRVREVLVETFGFPSDGVRLLLDGEATRAAILGALGELRDGARPGDEVFVYFAGHGSQVRNSLSDELDRLDETLVPADSAAGAPDIRDKELRRLANELLDRGARLTVALDCCHSGSALRGLPVAGCQVRRLPDAPGDVADGPPYGPPPEDRGALVLSAAQDDEGAWEQEDAEGRSHGAFTLALLAALAAAGAQESAERLFLRAKARLQAARARQEPVLAGNRERRQAPLFEERGSEGGRSREGGEVAAGLPAAVVRKVWPNGTVTLFGGIATGLQPGCELACAETGVRVRVTAAGKPGGAEALVIAGDPTRLEPGALFELDGWSVAGEPALAVWIAEHPAPWAEVEAFARELARAAAAAGVCWVEDPTLETPAQVLSWEGEAWRLTAADGTVQDLGPRPAPSEVLACAARASRGPAPPAREPAGLFVQLPAPRDLVRGLRLGAGTVHDAVERTTGPAGAHYLLVGRLGSRAAGFAWVRPGSRQGDPSPLPARSDWKDLPPPGMRGGGPGVAAHWLEAAALRLARVRSWLTLEPPPAAAHFPYHLALRPAGGGEPRTGGTLRPGETYGLVLQARPEDLEVYVERRYVYVFVLDSWGRTRLLFPPHVRGGVENRLPLERRGREPWPAEIPLGDPSWCIPEPCGTNTCFLLTTAEAIPVPYVLEADGVRTRGPRGRTALEELLAVRGGTRRGDEVLVPARWSLEKSAFLSLPG